MIPIESLLSARLFLRPQLVNDHIYFISNMSGRNSLYRMKTGGSVPEPLLPPDIALQNPHLMNGLSFVVFPQLSQILVMIDKDGDENYQPMLIPLEGGYPRPFQAEVFAGDSVMIGGEDLERNLIYFIVQSRTESIFYTYLADMAAGELRKLNESMYGGTPSGNNDAYTRFVLAEGYGAGDVVLFRYDLGDEAPTALYGTPIGQRQPGQEFPPNNINEVYFIRDETALFFSTSLFDDAYGPGFMSLDDPENVKPVAVEGIVHTGQGEMTSLTHLTDNHYLVGYNIDGCSWEYEAALDEESLVLRLGRVLVGRGELANGVLEAIRYDKAGDRYAIAYSTAVSPTQLYTLSGPNRDKLERHTNERILGVADNLLSAGEDYAFDSYDGLRISARLYLPAAELGFEGTRPLIYYIHGGPQGQERPDFAWFSMPFIQFLTLNGFAVFVPNVRGSTGYGFEYMKHVVRDWGGADRLDHVHAMTAVLPQDPRLDVSSAGVVGRSYGGYMTLTLAARHPELWSAAVDMFGPYNLLTFASRVPETWKPFIKLLMGDPETEVDFLQERSPITYIQDVQCPMLVVQGKNDPRVLEIESCELVEDLRARGNKVEYLMFEDEGHDVLKFENRVRVYNGMTDFFKEWLRP
ncbi:MAG: S9 family peptidase [Chloroflexi bacterium]|nr:S9 family peptidase [Chloroflexota bacterium]